MDEKRIRKISKKQMLELLLEQAKRIQELELIVEKMETKLSSKKISVDESGSIAEASLKLNNIFEIAQNAADQYILNVKEKCKKMQSDTKKECQEIKENMINETKVLCEEKIKETEEKCKKIKETNKNTSKKSVKSTVVIKNKKKVNKNQKKK